MSVQKIHLDHAQDSPRPLLQQRGQQAPSARGGVGRVSPPLGLCLRLFITYQQGLAGLCGGRGQGGNVGH